MGDGLPVGRGRDCLDVSETELYVSDNKDGIVRFSIK